MDLSVEEFIEGLLSPQAADLPSDTTKPNLDEMALPEWFEEKKFNRGRKFFWSNSLPMFITMLLGLISVFSVPSILKVLVTSQRSSSVYTAYKRYGSTLFHIQSWFTHDLKPGSVSWRSLHEVRSRHYRAMLFSKAKGVGTVSQRDLALTLFGFMGYAVVKPRLLGIQQVEQGDFDAYVHFWSIIGHMIGLEDRFNICRKNFKETREVCQIILDKVFTPAMTNTPEYFEHMARATLGGTWHFNPTINNDAVIYLAKYLAGVPGYIFYEDERLELEEKLRVALKGRPIDAGVPASELISQPAVEGLPKDGFPLLYLKDYEVLSEIPYYKQLSAYSKFTLTENVFILQLCGTFWGRLIFTYYYRFVIFMAINFPILAALRYGWQKAMVDMFTESPKDQTRPLKNSEYYKKRNQVSWLDKIKAFILNIFGFKV